MMCDSGGSTDLCGPHSHPSNEGLNLIPSLLLCPFLASLCDGEKAARLHASVGLNTWGSGWGWGSGVQDPFPFFCFFFRATSVAYGGSQARGHIGAAAASLHHSHGNVGSEPRLRPIPQLSTTQDL